jgi:hypothetical protein
MCHLPLQGTIRVWDVATADALATLRPHDADGVGDAGAIAAAAAHDDTARRLGTGGVLCLATSGAAVWSGSDDGELSLWALAPPYARLRRVADAGAGGRVACLAVMGEHLWSAGQHAAVRVWSRDGALLKELSGHTSYVHALCKVLRQCIRFIHPNPATHRVHICIHDLYLLAHGGNSSEGSFVCTFCILLINSANFPADIAQTTPHSNISGG